MYLYIYAYVYMYKCEKCIFRWQVIIKQVLLKMMKHRLLFLIIIFQVFLLFILCQDPGGQGTVPYLLPECFHQTCIPFLTTLFMHLKSITASST